MKTMIENQNTMLFATHLAGCVMGNETSQRISLLYEHEVAQCKPLEIPTLLLQVELLCIATKQGPKFRELSEEKVHPVKGGTTKTQEGPRLPA